MPEGAPLVAGKPERMVDLDEEAGQAADKGRKKHSECDPSGKRPGTLRKLQTPIVKRVDQCERDRSRSQPEHGCPHRSDRVAGGSVAARPERLCERVEGGANEPGGE